MELADILSEHSVLVLHSVKTKTDLLRTLAEKAASSPATEAAILKRSTIREALGSTGLGNGIAVPHGKLAGQTGRRGGVREAGAPVDSTPSTISRSISSCAARPDGAGADHLKALARVARVLRTDSLVDSLRATDDPARLYALLTAIASQHAA